MFNEDYFVEHEMCLLGINVSPQTNVFRKLPKLVTVKAFASIIKKLSPPFF